MSRCRLILLSLFAVFAFSAVATASASAKQCGSGTLWVFCYDSGEEIHEEIVLGLSGLSLLVGKIGGVTARFHCIKDDVVGTLELLGLNKGTITFLECKMTEPSGCKLSAAQETKIEIEVLSELTGHPEEAKLLFKLHGPSFVKLSVENGGGCPEGIPGSYDVTGDQTCSLPEWNVLKLLHEVVCVKTQSHLQLGGAAASFSSTAKLRLESDLNWAVLLGS